MHDAHDRCIDKERRVDQEHWAKDRSISHWRDRRLEINRVHSF